MKIARRFAAALFLGVLLVLSAHAWIRVRRETSLFEGDMQRDQATMGRALATAVRHIWRAHGRSLALELVEDANSQYSDVRVRWIDLDAPAGDPHAPRLPADLLPRLEQGEEATWVQTADDSRLYTCVPVTPEGGRPGALELSESTATERSYILGSLRDTIVGTVALVAIMAVLALALGAWFIGRPVQRLVEKARRVAVGDFGGPLPLGRRDELGDLASEMNDMSEKLGQATERIDRETRARIAAIEQLRRADRLMTVGKLASGIAHELGTPLNVVMARAKMIETGEVEGAAVSENAHTIVGQSQKMADIIRQLLGFARARASEKAPRDLAEIARQVLGLLSPLAEKRGVRLSLESEAGPAIAEVDAGQMEQVVSNIVVNAIQAMPGGGRVVVTTGRAPPGDDGRQHAFIAVKDDGVGIPPEVKEQLFLPFVTTKGVGEGTGLGLWVAHGIVLDHGGRIEVESEPGKGSTFTVLLPARGRP